MIAAVEAEVASLAPNLETIAIAHRVTVRRCRAQVDENGQQYNHNEIWRVDMDDQLEQPKRL